ncbi:formate/nitrite transporter family protein [Bengtsoniella intestinalis]|uniref:formate/nitrite transporter family protein n=1 Tax=Bengtsoniella intestinalis TaxID=3073143 RepID=UPI00391F37EC
MLKTHILNPHIPTLCKGILAGMMISLGASAYLSIDNHYIGAILFTIGLYGIYTLDFYLYTGKVGFFLTEKDLPKLAVIWLGNLIGTVSIAWLICATRLLQTSTLQHHATAYAATKLGDSYASIFILGILCGLMMYIAAAAFKTTQNTANSIGGYIGLFLCVMIFLLLGFEHSIANMFYFTVAEAWSLHAVMALLVVSAGNAVGGLTIPILLHPTTQH